jgi:hypothetical protein
MILKNTHEMLGSTIPHFNRQSDDFPTVPLKTFKTAQAKEELQGSLAKNTIVITNKNI